MNVVIVVRRGGVGVRVGWGRVGGRGDDDAEKYLSVSVSGPLF